MMVENYFSDWRPMINGVPQRLPLGPLLVVILVNDLDEKVQSMVNKFADDIRRYRRQ